MLIFPIKYCVEASCDGGVWKISVRGAKLKAVASNGGGWEHVSVSHIDRCPKWNEMKHIKEFFWDDEDVVIQYHPKKSEYKNDHKFCLHMWRKVGEDFETPPHWMV